MIPRWIRIIRDKSSTQTDISIGSQNTSDVTIDIGTNDYVYIGKYLPWNHLYFKMSDNVNSNTNTINLEYWDGTEWYDVVDILDDTSDGTSTFAQSGIIQWETDRNRAWNRVFDTSVTSGTPTELRDLTIYELYWLRFQPVTNELSANTAINKVGYLLTRQNIIDALDPDINEYLTSWASGKTDWTDQIMSASDHVILDLKSRGYIRSPAQILRFDELYLATAYRALAVIYSGLGNKFADKKTDAMKEYKAIMDNLKFTVDTDANARVTNDEVSSRIGMIVR